MKTPATTQLAILLSALSLASAHAVDRFVSPTGKDTNAGTLAAPWKTVQKAASSAKAGDTVFIRAGSYKEKVQINVSGTAAAPIVFRNYESEVAVLDLTGVAPGNDLSAIIRIPSRSYVTVQGLELRNFRTALDTSVPVGILVDGACTGVKLIGNKIHHIEQNNTDEGNFDANAHGIAAYGTSATPITGLVLDGNEVSNLRLGASEAIAINGNVNGFTISNNKVHDCNNIGIDVIGYEGTAPTAALDRARAGLITGNVVYNISSATNPAYNGDFISGGGDLATAGIYVDGGTATIIERNQVYACNYGIELAAEARNGKTDFITVRDNILHHNQLAGLTMGGYDELRGVTENCTISNNTISQNDTTTSWCGQIQFQFYVKNNSFKNNIIWANSSTKQIVVHYPGSDSATDAQKEFGTGNTFAYNLYYAVGGSTTNVAFEIFTKGNFKDFSSIAAWASSGKVASDVGSTFANPKFATATPATTSPASAFKLLAGSPAINTGTPSVVVALSEMDVMGEFRLNGGRLDRGADEF